jgi:hypothetical protein
MADPKTKPAAKPRFKCDATNDCGALDWLLKEQKRTGLVTLTLVNFKTGACRPVPGYRSKPHDAGIPLVFCPWCGVNLRKLRDAEKPKKGAARG